MRRMHRDRSRGEDQPRVAVGGYRPQPLLAAVWPRRKDRDRNDAGVQTAKERRDEVQTGGVEQESPLTPAGALLLKRPGYRARSKIELAEAQTLRLPPVGIQENVPMPVRSLCGSRTEDVHERRRRRHTESDALASGSCFLLHLR